MQTETERLAAYRRLRTEIRGSDRHLIVGIDIAKEKHHAFFGTATGKTLCKRLIFDNTREGFELLLSKTDLVRLQSRLDQVVFGLEPTANYHKPLAEYLTKRDYQVVQVSGNAVKQNRELLDGRWDKHDRKDAANIADLIAQAKCQFYEFPPMALRELRELLSVKRKLKKQEKGLKTRIRNNLLALYFPEIDRYVASCERESLAILEQYAAPSTIAAMSYDEFIEAVVRCDKGRKQQEQLRGIWQAAKQSIGCASSNAAGYEGAILVDQLRQTRAALQKLDHHIEQLCLSMPAWEHVISIPGFGPDTTAKVLAAIGDPYRFENLRQVLKLAGLDLNASRSGKPSQQASPVISKRGRSDLRYAMCQAALVASSRNKLFMDYVAHHLRGREHEKGIHGKMRTKLAAKLLVIAWTLMKKQERFNAEYLKVM